MKKRIFTFAGVLLFFCFHLSAGAIEDLLHRILPYGQDAECFETVLTPDGQPEWFSLSSDGKQIQIKGNTPSAITSGIHWYLHHYAGIDISWNQCSGRLPGVLPRVAPEKHSASVPFRYYLNYCTYSYSMAFWDWPRWEQEIDWMALHGINYPLALTGSGTVWKILLEKLGYSQAEINDFVAGPGFQAWFLMNNLQGWGGPNPDSWYTQQLALQDSILSRMTALGITPVLPGYSGMVPSDFGNHLPKGWKGSDLISSGGWCGFTRPAFIDNPLRLKEFAALYYQVMDSLFSPYAQTHYYSMDPFHEGSAPAGISSTAASYAAIYEALKAHDPEGKWVVQSWNSNPTQVLLETVPKDELIVLDLFSDGHPKWNVKGSYNSHPWAFCMLHNFGGRTGLHGRIRSTIEGFYQAISPTTVPPAMGIGATPEGIETNPILYGMLFELPWTTTTPDRWIEDYVFMRYGKNSLPLVQAWQLLANSVYNCATRQQGTSESVLCARPALNVGSVSTWSTSEIYWDPADVIEAVRLFLSVKKEFKKNNNYRYDVVDVLRQCLSTHAYYLLDDIRRAKESGSDSLNLLTQQFLTLLLDQDQLLGTRSEFRLGTWTEQARQLGTTPEEKDWYEFNARVQITTWGAEKQANGNGLHDYSNREWNGLLRDYAYPRWKAFFDGGCVPISGSTFFHQYEYPFAQGTLHEYGSYSSKAHGNSIETASKLFKRYFGH